MCLGGCNPLHSYSLTSCRPEPICANEVIQFPNLDRILQNATSYDGNATLHDFVVDEGTVALTSANELVLTLTETNNGTRISSTRYVHYGVISATIKTARSAGVVNAFITMSDVRDEIDWEWPGNQTNQAQSNYFFLGEVNSTGSNGQTHGGLTDTFSNYHEYTINWQPDSLTWSIDGNVVRTVNRVDTLSKDGTYYAYPSTPSRVQLSIWPAGIPSSPPGTVEWAQGMINWNDPDYIAQGHFSTIVQNVSISCSQETSATIANNGSIPASPDAYVYTTNETQNGIVPRVFLSNESTNVNAGMSIRGATGAENLMRSGIAAVGVAVTLGAVGLFI